MRLILLTLLLLTAYGCSPEEDETAKSDKPAGPKVADIAKDYKHLKLITPTPAFVDIELVLLCRGASQRDVEEARKKNGPHAYTSINIYMNDPAAAAFGRSATPYPVGAVIVKEKRGQGYLADDRKMAATANGVGGMVKRPPGFDPRHGDWEYFYFEDPAKIEAGKIETCVQCHSGAAGKDYVFGSWKRGG